MDDCIFCSIIDRKSPAWIIYEDEEVICFLPTKPEVYGHTVIASKPHFVDIDDAPASVLESVMTAAKRLAAHYKAQIGSTGINLFHASGPSAQQSVVHFHIHLIPRFESDGVNAWPEFPASTFDKDEMLKILKL